jgi:ATP-dependent DNA helicase DinG
VSLLDHFPPGATPRPEQARLLDALGAALDEADGDATAPRILLVEAPPGVGKSHVAMTLARWSGDAYLLTSQRMLQDQYEREFGADLQLVKGRDNYLCERVPGARVPTSQGPCRRPRGPVCQCPYARAKAAALAGPIFCTNTAYFATLRHWHGEQLRRRRLLIVDEAHHLESQLISVLTLRFAHDDMKRWFGAPLPRLASADEYRPLLDLHRDRLAAQLAELERALGAAPPTADFAGWEPGAPLSPGEQELLAQRDELDGVVARLRDFVDSAEREWVLRYDDGPGAAFELVPVGVTPMAADLLGDCAELVVLSSAYLGHRGVLAACFGLDERDVRAVGSPSPFSVEQRPIVYRPVGALSKATLSRLEPVLFAEIAAVLAAHARDKGLVHVTSYALALRLASDLAARAPRESMRLIVVESADAKSRALAQHRASPRPTVLVSPSLREGVDLPDDLLRFQIVTKMPYPDLGDPWIEARRARDPRWYALETAKALVQAYGRACRHAGDHGVTYVLDANFARFVQHYRPLLPRWFLDAASPALREHAERTGAMIGDDID